MDKTLSSQITLTFDGTLAPNHSVSLRTISYTVPHFQRAIDKTVYFHHYKELRKYTSLPPELHIHADLYINQLVQGSLKIPFLSDLLKGVPELFNSFLSQPYESAAHEVQNPKSIIQFDLETNKIHASKDNLQIVTQEQLVAREAEQKTAYTQAAIMKDISMALGLVRSTEGALLSFNVDSTSGMQEFDFDQIKAASFAKLATTKRLADAAVYTGKITGLEKHRGQFKYAAKFLSSTTKKESKILISDYDDALKLHQYNLADKEIKIWGAPVALYNAYDPVRGDFVFIDIFNEP